jgi:transcriptional regulator with XRE-family HTH domain
MSRQANDMKRRIGDRLSAAMDAKGISSAELARRFGWNEKTVRRWRGGEVMPGTENLAQAADLLGKDLSWFYLPLAEQAEPLGDRSEKAAA